MEEEKKTDNSILGVPSSTSRGKSEDKEVSRLGRRRGGRLRAWVQRLRARRLKRKSEGKGSRLKKSEDVVERLGILGDEVRRLGGVLSRVSDGKLGGRTRRLGGTLRMLSSKAKRLGGKIRGLTGSQRKD